MNCQICHSDRTETHSVREMMLGTGDVFPYNECLECGCLQLAKPPANPADYYPQDYYAFQTVADVGPSPRGLRRWLKRRRDTALLCDRSGIFRAIARRFPNPGIADLVRWLRGSSVRNLSGRILDVGCGRGDLLRRIRDLGFRQLTGLDPYLPTHAGTTGIELIRDDLAALADSGRTFDLIMLHHSLEHMPDQFAALRAIDRMMHTGSQCVVRIPITSRGAWRFFGVHWAEIDAPRHYLLHSDYSLSRVAAACGLEVTRMECEPDPFPWWASLLYRKDIPLYDPVTRQPNRPDVHLSTEELTLCTQLAIAHNTPAHTSRAAFYLRKRREAVSEFSATMLPTSTGDLP